MVLRHFIKKLRFALKIPLYNLFRIVGFPMMMPLNITIFTTYSCNSKCLICNVWKQKMNDELTVKEWKKVIYSLGSSPFWITLTGGETFLQPNFVDLVFYICKINRPLYLNIATNGLSTDLIMNKMPIILKICKKYHVKLTINFSIDGIGEQYDAIRGTKEGFLKVCKTIDSLKKYRLKYNLENTFNIGVNTTISKLNIDQFSEIYNYIHRIIKPDSFVSEIASKRVALFIKGEDIVPDYDKYLKTLDFLISKTVSNQNIIANLIERLRINYYKTVKQFIINKSGLPCYAGIASVEILPDGKIISCCMKSFEMGSLRNHDYNIKDLLKSIPARFVRKNIKKTKCTCTLANPYYTNSLIGFKFK